MSSIQDIYEAIAAEGFSKRALRLIDKHVNDIQNGTRDFPRYNLSEHAGLCKVGSVLIGAAIVAGYATASLTASLNAAGGQEGSPANWQIDELQERFIELWAKAAQLWVEDSDKILTDTFGPMIAQGAEAKVYYREGDTSVIKERTSIYSTTQKALDAIALHYYLFPETAMDVIGFTRDNDGLMRIILTQPYIRCLRLATKDEIDALAIAKEVRDNWSGQGVNYISDRICILPMSSSMRSAAVLSASTAS